MDGFIPLTRAEGIFRESGNRKKKECGTWKTSSTTSRPRTSDVWEYTGPPLVSGWLFLKALAEPGRQLCLPWRACRNSFYDLDCIGAVEA